MKFLIGVSIAAVLLLGGYFLYTNYTQPVPPLVSKSSEVSENSPLKTCPEAGINPLEYLRTETEPLAATPKFVGYTDPDSGISFTYPSAIARVRAKNTSIKNQFVIATILPCDPATEWVSGGSITVEACTDTECSTDLPSYILKRFAPSNSNGIDSVTITASSTPYVGFLWVKFLVGSPIGSSDTSYARLYKNKLILIASGEPFASSDIPHITAAFEKMFESVSF